MFFSSMHTELLMLCLLCLPPSSSLSARVASLTSYAREKLSLNSSRRSPSLRMISLSWTTPGRGEIHLPLQELRENKGDVVL